MWENASEDFELRAGALVIKASFEHQSRDSQIHLETIDSIVGRYSLDGELRQQQPSSLREDLAALTRKHPLSVIAY